ncbi:BsaA family SipW-dependent biofilm matrix protein [Candidatus Saccharibacteria bacterium]|nr:BsaA family SipW-dependent biofilm matrix protein [Candidatus Saccharibacteria bacterium]
MKNKKPLLAIIALIGVAAVVGGVLSFYHENRKYENEFGLGQLEIEAIETFESPDGWMPCQEVKKSVLLKNSGGVAATARISYTEYWKSKNNTDLPLQKDGRNVAQISFANPGDWELHDDGWYYYKNVLEPDEATSEFIDGVVLDCQMNLGGENVCTTTNNETVCVTPDNEYAGAKYYLNLKLQLISAESTAIAIHHVQDCNVNYLYNKIECSVNYYYDSNLVFNDYYPDKSGIFENSDSNGGEFPIYYYRGTVSNNYVVWADYCWQILHTTTTGGVKMIYSGEAVNGQCEAEGVEKFITYNGETAFQFSTTNSRLSDVGYMKPNDTSSYSFDELSLRSNVTTEYSFAKNVTYNETTNRYTLIDPITGPWSESYYRERAFDKKYYYFCVDGSTSCESVAYYLAYSGSTLDNNTGTRLWTISYLLLDNGLTRDAILKDFNSSNQVDSNAKAVVEGWFEEHLNLYEGDLEDTVYCGNRTVVGETLDLYTYNRFIDNSGRPTFKCPRKEDRYTKYSAYGNRKLKHRVGLISSDESVFAGINRISGGASCGDDWCAAKVFLYARKSIDFWTMSPSRYVPLKTSGASTSNSSYAAVAKSGMGLSNKNVSATAAIRPVVSLKPGTRYDTSTDGTAANPYKIVKE